MQKGQKVLWKGSFPAGRHMLCFGSFWLADVSDELQSNALNYSDSKNFLACGLCEQRHQNE